jgi:hypothetical protein
MNLELTTATLSLFLSRAYTHAYTVGAAPQHVAVYYGVNQFRKFCKAIHQHFFRTGLT